MSNQPLKKPTPTLDPPKKISIKQFEWYEVQTKVRQLLTQLLQPFTKKQMQDTVKMNEFKRNLTTMQKKLQDHDFLLTQQNAEKPTYVQLQDDKILAMQNKFIELQVEQNRRINDMKKTIQIYQAKITQVNQIETRIQLQIKQRNIQFKQHKEYLDQQIELMMKRLDNQDTQMNTLRQSTRNTINKLQTKTIVIDNRLVVIQDEMKRKTQDLKRVNDQITNMNQKIAGADLEIKDLDSRLQQREKDYKLSQKFLAKTIQLQNSVSFIQNYLRFYQPLYTQMQISQTINSFLKGTMKTRASLYEQKIFAQMHYAILSLQQDTLESKMSDYSNRIRKIINRNKKYLIRMKVQQTYKYGSNVYQIREIDESVLEKVQQVNNKPPQIIVPQQEINKLIEQKWQKIVISVQNRINQKTQPFKIWMKELQEQSMLKQIQLDNKMTEIKNRMEKEEVSVQLFKSQMKEIQKQMMRNIQYLYKQVKRQKEKIKDLINFSSVINHIVIQDQIDRQGLALYALRSGSGQKGEQSNQQNYPNVHIDEKCISCQNGNSSIIVNQAFKMACLAYNPSQIKIEDRVFSREQILQISTNILDKLKKKIQEVLDKQKLQVPLNKVSQSKNRSKSTVSRQLNTSKNAQLNTIDIPVSSRLRDTTYTASLFPVLGAIKKKSSISSHRERINI